MKKALAVLLALSFMTGCAIGEGQVDEYAVPRMEGTAYYLEKGQKYIVGDGGIEPGEYHLKGLELEAVVSLKEGSVLDCKGWIILDSYLGFAALNGLIEGGLESVAAPVQTFTVEAGEYVVGEDIPAGTYSIEALEGSSASVIIHKADGQLVKSELLWYERGRRIGKIEILDGYTVKVGGGGCRFGAPGGVSFD